MKPVIGKLIDFEEIPAEIQAMFDRKTVGRTSARLYRALLPRGYPNALADPVEEQQLAVTFRPD